MSYRISEEKISEVRNATDIVDVISEVVKLRKAGKNFLGLCPFHSEKTPSFTVSPDKQIFYCFGCGEGGNVFSFLMKHERMTFPEAVRGLARRRGIDLPEPASSPEAKKAFSERENLFRLNELVMHRYQGMLKHPKAGQKAMGYLVNRGVSDKTIQAFQLGYAPDGWQHLADFLQRKRIPAGLAEKAGLIVPRKEKSGFYDRFRSRIIFPIFNIGEQVVGFGGRTIDPDGMPKYLNSPETPLYNKRRQLYGLHLAKQHCRRTDTVYIVEGYLDCITLHQHGLCNAVATLGTALTSDHVRILRGFARNVILVFDSDEAGLKAATRSIGLFMEQHVDARIFVLPSGSDPDSYVQTNGLDRFIELSSQAYSIVEFLIDMAVKKHGLSIDGKVAVVNEMLGPMAALDDPVARSLYVKAVSERVGIEESAILAKLNVYSDRKGRYGTGGSGSGTFRQESAGNPDGKVLAGRGTQMERQIVAMMLQFPDIIADIRHHKIVEYLKDPLLKSIGVIILNSKADPAHFVSDVLNHLDNAEQKQVVAQLSIHDGTWAREGCEKIVQRFKVQIQLQEEKQLTEKIKQAEKDNDTALLVELLAQKQKNAVNMEKQKMTLMEKSLNQGS